MAFITHRGAAPCEFYTQKRIVPSMNILLYK